MCLYSGVCHCEGWLNAGICVGIQDINESVNIEVRSNSVLVVCVKKKG